MADEASSGARKKFAGPDRTFDAIKPGKSHHLAFTGTSAQTPAFATGTSIIEVMCSTDAYIAIGADPTAATTTNTTTSLFMPAGVTKYYACAGVDKCAALQSSAAGTMHIVEGA